MHDNSQNVGADWLLLFVEWSLLCCQYHAVNTMLLHVCCVGSHMLDYGMGVWCCYCMLWCCCWLFVDHHAAHALLMFWTCHEKIHLMVLHVVAFVCFIWHDKCCCCHAAVSKLAMTSIKSCCSFKKWILLLFGCSLDDDIGCMLLLVDDTWIWLLLYAGRACCLAVLAMPCMLETLRVYVKKPEFCF